MGICYITFLRDFKAITKINNVIVPVLIIVVFFTGIINLFNIELESISIANFENFSFIWLIRSFLYSSYNLIILIPALVKLRGLIKNKNQIILSSTITGIILFLITIIVFLLLANSDTNLKNIEMPVIFVIENKFPKLKYLYGTIILIAIFTTAISVGTSFLNNICKNKKSYKHVFKLMCISSIIISKIGFSNLVEMLFPAFGILGIFQIYFILRCNL